MTVEYERPLVEVVMFAGVGDVIVASPGTEEAEERG